MPDHCESRSTHARRSRRTRMLPEAETLARARKLVGFQHVRLDATWRTVQLLLAGMLMPVKLSEVAPADNVLGVVPVHVPPTAPPAALIFTRVSVNAPPVRAVALLLVMVTVTVDVPPD